MRSSSDLDSLYSEFHSRSPKVLKLELLSYPEGEDNDDRAEPVAVFQ